MTTLREMKEERAKLVKQSREIIDRSDKDAGGVLTAEDREQLDRFDKNIGEINDKIQTGEHDFARRQKVDGWNQYLDSPAAADPEPPRSQPNQPEGNTRTDKPIEVTMRDTRAAEGKRTLQFLKDDQRKGFSSYWQRGQDAYLTAFRSYLMRGAAEMQHEQRATLQADSDVGGGYLVPTQVVGRLIQAVDDLLFIRGLATVFPLTTGDSMGAPSLDSDPADFDWTAELTPVNEDTGIGFGKRELTPHPLSKLVKISNKLLRTAALNPEDIVLQRLAHKLAVTEEKGFLTGSGAGQPLGVFTASTDGISTARDVATGNSTTAIAFDGLISAKYALKSQYWSRARWMFHRDAMAAISKLKDSDGQYLWRPSVREGEPDRILGHPVDVSEFVPNTFTTGLYVGMFCDWSDRKSVV